MMRTVLILLISLVATSVWSAEEIVGEPLEEVGTRLDLPSGNKLQLAIDEKKVVGHFIDKDGNLIESPAESIVFVVDQSGHRNDKWRTVIKPVDAAKLTSTRSLVAPYSFKARLIIRFKDGSTKTLPNAFVELDKKAE